MDVLLVDDDPAFRLSFQMRLEARGCRVRPAAGGEEGLSLYREARPDVVLLDYKMPGLDGLQVLRRIRREDPEAQVVILTAHGSIESAVLAIREGASDYLTKPVEPERLGQLLGKVEARRGAGREGAEGAHEAARLLVGVSPAVVQVREVIRRVAPSEAPVLLLGESGTGKEVAATLLHRLSRRREGPFVAASCPAIPATLFESEMFGHEKGAFTGAVAQRRGLAEQASGGTLFLDEVAEMPPEMQAKLLRALETKSFARVGGSSPLWAEFRVVAATNAPLAESLKSGRFREDLYYRLNTFTLSLPPLRERREDIPELVDFFCRQLAAELKVAVPEVDPEALAYCFEHPWPGNVRQLRSALLRALVLGEGRRIRREDLEWGPGAESSEGEAPRTEGAGGAGTVQVPLGRLEEAERRLIEATLAHTGGNRRRAARLLDISEKTLYNKLKRFSRR
ncbi:MAG: sigma-54-dependent transcriptional regulator [Nitrospinota bacterium]